MRVLTTKEAEAGRLQGQGQPEQLSELTYLIKIRKKKLEEKAGNVSQR